MNKNLLPGLIGLLLLITGCQKPGTTPQELPTVPPPQDLFPSARAIDGTVPAPNFAVPGINGDTIQLSDYRGKTLLINFWATWCGPCIVEIPDLIALQNELGEESFAVIGLSMDLGGTEDVQKFAKSMEINYPIGMDDGRVAEAFGGIFSLPTTYVIDKEGLIKQRTIGVFPAEAFKPHLISMIEAD